MILKYNETLRSISKLNPNLSAKELEDKKRKIVKRVCELKVKLVKLKEDEEFEVALRDQTNIDSANGLFLLIFFCIQNLLSAFFIFIYWQMTIRFYFKERIAL